jgi:hypothetical protein
MWESFDKAHRLRTGQFLMFRSPLFGARIYDSIRVTERGLEIDLMSELNNPSESLRSFIRQHGDDPTWTHSPDIIVPLRNDPESRRRAQELVERIKARWDRNEMPDMGDLIQLFGLIGPRGCSG